MKVNKYSALILIAFFLIAVFSLFITNEFAFTYEGYNYLISQALLFLLLYTLKKDGTKFMFSPSFIAVSYININFILGSYLFKSQLVFTRLLPEFNKWDFYDLRVFFFNAINFLIILSFFLKIRLKLKRKKLPLLLDLKRIDSGKLFIVTAVLFLLLSPVNFSFSIIAKSLLAIILFILTHQRYTIYKRIFFYCVIVFIFILFSSHSKREAIFLLLPILLLESYNTRIVISFKRVLIFLAGGFLLLYAIIAMSILRGYGGYKVDNFFDAQEYVFEYMTSHYFLPAIANNLEISSTYLHSNNSIEYLQQDRMQFMYGETFIKPFFIFFPSSIIKKPDNSIGYYTRTFDAEFRKKGGSLPISIQSEFYLNFGLFSLFFIIPFFMIFNGMYKSILQMIGNGEIINYAYFLFIYQIYLSLVRGSGLDIFFVYCIFLIFFFVVYKIAIKVLTLPLNAKSTQK